MTDKKSVVNWDLKPGPKKKERTAIQRSVTFPPELYDRIEKYMADYGHNNFSGTVAKFIEIAFDIAYIEHRAERRILEENK